MASTGYKTCLLSPLALFLSGCMFVNGLDWSEDSFTRNRPNQADVIGVWVPTASTIRDLMEHGGYVIAKHELILRVDGAFAMVNMPDWWLDGAGESKKGFESGSGKWEFYQGHIQWTVWGIELNFGKFATGNLINLRRQKPPYLINITIGDPDSAHNMLFEKVPDPKQR